MERKPFFFSGQTPTHFIELQNDEDAYRLTQRQTDQMKDSQTIRGVWVQYSKLHL